VPLPLPRLDVRTFDQLVAEGQALLPLYAPTWTDYNVHDPGITLLELLAWLSEMGFYRLDRTPAASLRAFLRLAGAGDIRAARAADTVLAARLNPPATSAIIAAGAQVANVDETVTFQVTDDTAVSGAQIVAMAATVEGVEAWYVAFDRALARTTAPLGLFVSTGAQDEDRRTRARLQEEWEAADAEARKAGSPLSFDIRPHYGVRTQWEYYAGAAGWRPLEGVEDETRSLTLSGLVRFRVPAAPPHLAGGLAEAPSNLFFIRGRLARGRYDCPPRIESVVFNALRVRHAVDRTTLSITESTGRAGQVFALPHRPIVPGTTRIAFDGAADPAWSEVAGWDRSGPHDRAFVVDHDRGEIRFGDGRAGRVPPAGADLDAAYQVGGGPSGNVPAATLTRVLGRDDVAVSQPYPAAGGSAPEELDAAIGRALAGRRTSARAITLADFEALALDMPGAPIARTHAIAGYDPRMPCLPAAGSLTVVVVPHCPAARPVPSDALLHAVGCYLERRRTLTTQVHVVAPCFTTVSVQARLYARPGADSRDLASAARRALERFFDPLHGGPDGSGWPVGRDVYRAEVMALLNDVPGVSHVDEVAIKTGDGPSDRCGNAVVCRHGLVVSGIHQITIDSGSHCR